MVSQSAKLCQFMPNQLFNVRHYCQWMNVSSLNFSLSLLDRKSQWVHIYFLLLVCRHDKFVFKILAKKAYIRFGYKSDVQKKKFEYVIENYLKLALNRAKKALRLFHFEAMWVNFFWVFFSFVEKRKNKKNKKKEEILRTRKSVKDTHLKTLKKNSVYLLLYIRDDIECIAHVLFV